MTLQRVAALVTAICVCLFFTMTGPVLAKSTADKKSTTTSKKTKSSTSKSKSKSSSKKSASKKKSTKKSSSAAKSAAKKFTGKVNMNKATAEELMQLPGIGPVKAKSIIKYRKKHGSFKKAEDLLQVEGIGEETVKKLKSNMRF